MSEQPTCYVEAVENLAQHDWSVVLHIGDRVAVVSGNGPLEDTRDVVAAAVSARSFAEKGSGE